MNIRFSLSTTIVIGLITGIIMTSPSLAEQKPVTTLDVTMLEKMNKACLTAAQNKGYSVAIAIFNDNGTLLSFNFGGTAPAAGEVARWKGLSAALYRASTVETAKWNIPTAPKISTAQGGVPIFTAEGIALGGIGVSGAPPQFDEDCGSIAARAVGLRVNN